MQNISKHITPVLLNTTFFYFVVVVKNIIYTYHHYKSNNQLQRNCCFKQTYAFTFVKCLTSDKAEWLLFLFQLTKG